MTIVEFGVNVEGTNPFDRNFETFEQAHDAGLDLVRKEGVDVVLFRLEVNNDTIISDEFMQTLGPDDLEENQPEAKTIATLAPRELNAVLVGLRLLQQHLVSAGTPCEDILTNGGVQLPLAGAEIDSLCERINV